ncbi:MAG: carbon starvation CstA family protein [Syntrophomonadales bacterium]
MASGTTSKQLARESDAKPVGYGVMLLEGMFAVVSIFLLQNEKSNVGAGYKSGAIALHNPVCNPQYSQRIPGCGLHPFLPFNHCYRAKLQ